MKNLLKEIEKLKKSKPPKLRIFISVIFAWLSFFGCKQANTKPDIGYGKQLFQKNCSSCHGNISGFKNAQTMLELSKYDSLTLEKKLTNLNAYHGDYFKSKKFSEKDLSSLLVFIKDYNKPKY